MVIATFTDEMKKILSNMIGRQFVSYECEKDNGFTRAFGNMRINIESFSIELTNEEHTLTFFDDTEDITHFACMEVDSKKSFKPAVVTETCITEVGKVITGLELINDTISVNHGEYEISFDTAIIIHMGNDIMMLAKDTWFSEIITIADNDDYDQVFSIEDVKEVWSNDGENTVDVKRTRMNP